jgi:hypothetical protein
VEAHGFGVEAGHGADHDVARCRDALQVILDEALGGASPIGHAAVGGRLRGRRRGGLGHGSRRDRGDVGEAARAPAGAAAAETRTFLNTEGFGPSEAGGTIGPATHYPGTVEVAGVPGTVTGVTLTAIELNAGGELDMALVGPNGAQVMLMSDACRTTSAQREIWTFADDAPIFVPQLSCTFGQTISVRPTNYEPESDNFGPKGPPGPFTNSLAAFDGISPNGAWQLFMIDDSAGVVGCEMRAFALHLEIEPPPPTPPPAPIVQTVLVPGPATAPAPTAAPKRAKKTGKRAAALAKCKLKKTKAKRVSCRAKARKLPL